MDVTIADLEKRLIFYLKNVHIEITRPTSGSVTLSLPKAGEMARGIIGVLKDIAGEPVLPNEEISFNGGEWVVVLEE
jgi:hypothetical protein